MRSFDPETLMAHAGPLHRLARRLVADEARADDVVQETWLAALRRPPSEDANLRGWLFRVARNVARKKGREEDRRRGREERSARPETIVDDAAERAATQREFADQLLRLEEPYRAVLLLRYFEDQTPMMISETLQLPLGTVHTRILRGRERLRAALERHFADRDGWCAALLAFTRYAPTPPAAPGESARPRPYLVPLGLLAAAGALLVALVLRCGLPPESGVHGIPIVPPVEEGAEQLSDPPSAETPPPDVLPPEPEDPRLTDLGPDVPADPPVDPTDESLDAPPVGDVAVDDPPVDSPRGQEAVARADRVHRGAPAGRGKDGAPPALVLIKGGRTKVGTPVKEVEPLILENEQIAKPLAGETPRHTVQVDDFYLMPNEVTMEQYAAYVRSTGAKPPWIWGNAAVDEARRAYLEAQGQLAKEAREKGIPFDRVPFDAERWWDQNWRDKKWAVPEDETDRPVVYVSYRDAQAYARWAGLRLMTEREFARAARRDTDRAYTWGDDFDPKACASILDTMGRTMPVGTYPKGAVEGIHDLCGNVWEWTSSPFDKFPGHQLVGVKDGKRSIDTNVLFDSNQRVLVGGSFQQDALGVRISTRMFAERRQSTDALGFRCAASTKPGLDSALAILEEDVKFNVLPPDFAFHPQSTVALQVWYAKPGTAGKAIPAYRVITGHERMLFLPAEKIAANSVKELADMTVAGGPVYLGLVSIDRPLMEPALVEGSYHVAYRAAGKLADGILESEQAVDPARDPGADYIPSFTEAMGFDPAVDQFLFFDLDGEPLVTMPAGKLRYERLGDGGSVVLEPWEPPKRADPENPPIPMDTLRFQLVVAGKSGSKGFHFDLPLKLEPGAITTAWK